MIKGNKPVKIKKYAIIDHMAEGLPYISPKENVEIIGYPYGYCEDSATPHIEHIVDGKVYLSVNCADVSWIEFEIE